MNWWVYKCNIKNEVHWGDWRSEFFNKARMHESWGKREGIRIQKGHDLNKDDMIIAYQTRKGLVGTCKLSETPQQSNKYRIYSDTIRLFERDVKVGKLKKSDHRIKQMKAFEQGPQESIRWMDRDDATYLLNKAACISKLKPYKVAPNNLGILSEHVHKLNAKRRFEPEIVDLPKHHKGGCEVQTKGETINAENIESELLNSYRAWLGKKGRKLLVVKYGALECDGYEKKRKNLIEAKASAKRESIRMAVGQLLDYAFLGDQGKKPLGEPHKAILLPKKPHPEMINWLRHLHIYVIWRAGNKFKDNADGQFS